MSPAERRAIDLLAQQRELTFQDFLRSHEFCAVDPSPMVAAIVDASEGRRPTTIDDATAQRYFGCSLDALPHEPRRVVGVQAGGRGGKTSRLLATKALHAAWTVPLPTLAQGEHAVSLIVSSEMVFARQALSFCAGYARASPVLSSALVDDPGTDSLTLRRPDGAYVDIRVRAAGTRGKGGRAFTLVFAGFDEACFFYDDSGAVNDREIYRACIQRIVPGGQLWMVSTPWIDGEGLLEEKLAADFGVHDQMLAVRGIGTRVLNPSWDPDGSLEASLRADDPDNAEREIDAKPLVGGSAKFFASAAIDAAVERSRPFVRPFVRGTSYGAGGDIGLTRNSSALAIVGRDGENYHLARLDEIKPARGMPLKVEAVTAAFAPVLVEYQTGSLATDSHHRDDANLELAKHGRSAVAVPEGQQGKAEMFVLTRKLLHEGRIQLPDHPRLVRQLRDVVARPMPGGGLAITSPKRADGSHGDLVSAFVAAVWAVGMSGGAYESTAARSQRL